MSLLAGWRKTAPSDAAAEVAVTALYHEHALGLTRLAQVMLGDRAAAEDVVHDAFIGLYRRWGHLEDQTKAQAYLRSSVLNGCRTAIRKAARADDASFCVSDALGDAADNALLATEDRRTVMAALRSLPDRQREVLVLRYYLDLSDTEIAHAMGIRGGTVRSTAHRGLTALASILKVESP
jgi:RNA polymerase sigma-70 factor (sigma-E family)